MKRLIGKTEPTQTVLQERSSVTKIVEISSDAISEAVSILLYGGIVALPTETVYGLAADAMNDDAVKAIYAAKGRPARNPLIVHLLDLKSANNWAQVNDLAQVLIDKFWPGPLTLVLPKSDKSVSQYAGAGLNSVALRCPKTTWAKDFLKAGFDSPIVMPSANRSGHISPTSAAHVKDDLGDKIDLILDGGTCPNGIESTVLKIEANHAILLRPGAIPIEDFAPFISDLRLPQKSGKLISPGMMKSHYAPNANVRLNAKDRNPGEAFIGFGPSTFAVDFNLSETGDLAEAARKLYNALRKLDTVSVIAVAPIPETGLGAAINDRLRRAAADKKS